MKAKRARTASGRRSGFTLIELLVVIAIYRGPDFPAAARRPTGARGGSAGPVQEQSQTDRLAIHNFHDSRGYIRASRSASWRGT